MKRGRLLVVEDDFDISNMLRIYFDGMGYEVSIASRGIEALELTRQQLPNLIILDIMLPDMDGYSVCKELRTKTRTSHIPIIFLTQKDERSDRIAGLELGVDDYITKPFDIEELKLRIQNAITRAERESLTDPRSGLPSSRLIEEHLKKVLRSENWAVLDCQINHLDPYKDLHGFLASDDVIRSTAMMIQNVVNEIGSEDDFIGHSGEDHFLVITSQDAAQSIQEQLEIRFKSETETHYSAEEAKQGYILASTDDGAEEMFPLMTLTVGIARHSDRSFSDIREITELAAEARRRSS